MKNKKIVLASDGSGFDVKEAVRKHLLTLEIVVDDLSPEPLDYYNAGYRAGTKIKNKEADFAIIFCGNGYGIGYAASLVEGTFVVNCANTTQAKSSRAVNDANVLSMGGNIVTPEVAIDITNTFLNTNFGYGLSQEVQAYLKDSFTKLSELKK